jgi:hypothetical protein
MSTLHDPAVRGALKKRVQSLRPDSQRKWGRMTVDQMLWHVNLPMRECLGEYTSPPAKAPMPKRLLRWLTLNMPWPKGAPTRPDLVASGQYDFEQERANCLALIDRVAARDVSEAWPVSSGFGEMSGAHWSRLHARHLDHHLKQFGA